MILQIGRQWVPDLCNSYIDFNIKREREIDSISNKSAIIRAWVNARWFPPRGPLTDTWLQGLGLVYTRLLNGPLNNSRLGNNLYSVQIKHTKYNPFRLELELSPLFTGFKDRKSLIIISISTFSCYAQFSRISW